AESDGFLDDLHDRLFWPYRDWVIKAFNTNMPYDQFGTWQIAGDLLASARSAPRGPAAGSASRDPAYVLSAVQPSRSQRSSERTARTGGPRPDPREQTLATAFLRVGKRTSENGSIDEEYRAEYMVDR